MVNGLWGKKIGMTQVFSDDNKVVPVTVIDISNWYITQIKTKEKDGYTAVQIGRVKDRFADESFSTKWLKEPQKYFSALKEVPVDEGAPSVEVGQAADAAEFVAKGDVVDVFGITKGAGFQGVVKRHGFAGGRASHGATFGRFPGGMSFMRSKGRVIKGKELPGHMGVERRVMKNLEVVKVEPGARVLVVKGSIPGKSGSLVFVRKCR